MISSVDLCVNIEYTKEIHKVYCIKNSRPVNFQNLERMCFEYKETRISDILKTNINSSSGKHK